MRALVSVLVVLAGLTWSGVSAEAAAAPPAHRIYLPSLALEAPTAPPEAAVYLVYGQSNAVGQGAHQQPYTGPAGLAFIWRGSWEPAADPFSGWGGSWIPRLASRLASAGHPSAFIAAGVNSQPIAMLAPGSRSYYQTMLFWAREPKRPITAVLYWQGESDVALGTTSAAYRAGLVALAAAVRRDLNAPLIVAEVGNGPSDVPIENYEPIRNAQRDCWTSCADILRGPTFADVIHPDPAEWHFRTDAELTLAGDRWYDAIVAAH